MEMEIEIEIEMDGIELWSKALEYNMDESLCTFQNQYCCCLLVLVTQIYGCTYLKEL
jgi:hypothetical protein